MAYYAAYRRWARSHAAVASSLAVIGAMTLHTIVMKQIFGPIGWSAAFGVTLTNLAMLIAFPASALLLRWRFSLVPAALASLVLISGLIVIGYALRGVGLGAETVLLTALVLPFALIIFVVNWRTLTSWQGQDSLPA